MGAKDPVAGTHVPGTLKGEEMVRKHGREPGRNRGRDGPFRNARDSTGIGAQGKGPIDPRSPSIPPA